MKASNSAGSAKGKTDVISEGDIMNWGEAKDVSGKPYLWKRVK